MIAIVLNGITQGRFLSPVLFICFVNDMPDVVHASFHMIADDTKLYMAVNTPEDTETLQTNMTKLEQRENQWQLRFNAEKYKVMYQGINNTKQAYTIQKEGKAEQLETMVLKRCVHQSRINL